MRVCVCGTHSSRSLKDWLWLGGLGMMGMVFNQLLFLSGLSLTTATNAGMVSPAISVFSTAISALLCLEKLSLWKLGGISITVVGALIILEVRTSTACGVCRVRSCAVVCGRVRSCVMNDNDTHTTGGEL
jgi:drug/metabolite transporter (DMT)-like permease